MIETLFFALPFVGERVLKTLPIVLATALLAEWLKRNAKTASWTAAMRARPIVAVMAATAAGALSPLCSCGVIPIIAGFLRAGLPLGPVMAFWIASPSMDPEIFALSAAGLGWPLAIARLVATGLMSVLAGLAAHALERRGAFGADYLRGTGVAKAKPRFTRASLGRGVLGLRGGRVAGGSGPSPSRAGASACACSTESDGAVLREGGASACACGTEPKAARISSSVILSAGREALKLMGIMALAFCLEALVIRFVPMEAVAPLLGNRSPFAVFLAVAVGIPLYTTNMTALGLVAGLLGKGMSQGAALAFLIGGAVTTVPAMTAVWTLVKRPVFLFYILAAILGSLGSGFAWEAVASLF